MLRENRQFINPRFDHVAGGLANETRYDGYDDPAEREYKRYILPTYGSSARIIFEAGWNKIAAKKDVVRITIEDRDRRRVSVIIRRIDLEQMDMAMAQGDEMIKHVTMEYEAQRDKKPKR